MKIRLDFVTNSSSSSFTCVAMYSEDLYNFLQKLIAEGKHCAQPNWTWTRPEDELHLEWAWEELKFDQQWYKVQTTEEYGDTDKESIFKYICYFFEGLTPEEENTLKELISEVYSNKDYQTKKFKGATDGYIPFDFKGMPIKADREGNSKQGKIQELLDKINKMAVDPKTEDLSMKSVAVNMYQIDGHGIYAPESERYQHIDKSFLDRVRLGWVSSDYTDEYKEQLLIEEKRNKWGEHLRILYEDAFDDIGAILMSGISSRSDYAVVINSTDGAVEKYMLQDCLVDIYGMDRYNLNINRVPKEILQKAKESCYVSYLGKTLSALKEANQNRHKDQPPVRVIWEDQMHDYLMHHSSLGNVTPDPVVGPKGTVRRKVPQQHKRTIDQALTEMVARWPLRIINPKTITYEKLLKDIKSCCQDIGYSSADEFFDAYGFSIKQDKVNKNASQAGDYEFEKSRKNEVTIVRYIGEEAEVVIPDSIDGGIVRTIGKDAFGSNDKIEVVIVPESVTTLRGRAFGFSRNLKKVHLSNNIDKFVAGTFDGCGSLEDINIPDCVKELPSKLFRDCPIKSLHIGKSLSVVDKDVFYGGEIVTDENYQQHYAKTSAVESITVDPDNKNLKSIESMLFTFDGKALLAMLGDDESCTIPEGVEIIADKAFARNGHLKEVDFPESLWLIGNDAFESTGLKTVSFPSNVKTIGAGAFRHCTSLENVTFVEGLEEIYNGAFWVTKIRQVSFPESLKKLGKHSFDGWNLQSVEPPEREKEIRRWGPSFTDEKVNTNHYINELKTAGIKAAVDSQFDNKVGLGLLAIMMTCLQSDDAANIDMGTRLKLEQIVISKKMESILKTDLKLILSFFREDSTKQLVDCINYVKTEAEHNTINEYYKIIREAFPDDKEIDILLEKTEKVIRKEV